MNTRFSKSIIVLAIVSLLGAGSAVAGKGNQDGTGVGGGNGGDNTEWTGGSANKMARMSERLGLDENQENAVLEHFRYQEAQRANMQAMIMAQFGDEICAQREANQGSFEGLLLTILDEDQLLLHEEMKANREANQGNRQSRRGNGGLECPTDG